MKVLLCTPYIRFPEFVQGGLVVWSQNILRFHQGTSDNIELVPISFDRTVKGREATSKLAYIWYTISEIGKSVNNVLKEIKIDRYDVLHLCTSAGPSLIKDIILLRAAKKKGVKGIIHFHFGRIPEIFQKKNWEYKLLMKNLRLASVIVTMDKMSFDVLSEAGFSNVRYLPNPISDDVLIRISHQDETTNIKEHQLLYVGHVYRTKGVYELVEACSKIDNISLKIVGKYTDDVKRDLESIAKTKNTNWLTFEGEMNHDEVIREFLTSDIFVFPSYTEGFPNVILEAMACRIPIVSTAVGAIPEMLNGGKKPCGVLIEPKSVQQVYDAVLTLLDDDEKKRSLVGKAFDRVVNNYSMPVVWKELVNIWKS